MSYARFLLDSVEAPNQGPKRVSGAGEQLETMTLSGTSFAPKLRGEVGNSQILWCIVNNRGFLTWGYPQNEWFIMEKTIKMDDLGVPLFQETSI